MASLPAPEQPDVTISQRRLLQRPLVLVDRVRRDSLLRNSVFIMVTMLVNSALGFVFWLLAARLFPVPVVGLTAAIVASGTIILLLSSLGAGGMLIQSLPEHRERSSWSLTFWAGMATAVAASIVLACLALGVLPFLSDNVAVLHSPDYATIFAIGTVVSTAGAIIDYAFVAERVTGKMLGRNTVVAVAKVLMIVVLTLVAVEVP